MSSDHLQVTLPDGGLQRMWHSTTAITLCPGLVEVIIFGGCPDDFDPKRPAKDDPRMAETNIITFSEYYPSPFPTEVLFSSSHNIAGNFKGFNLH